MISQLVEEVVPTIISAIVYVVSNTATKGLKFTRWAVYNIKPFGHLSELHA